MRYRYIYKYKTGLTKVKTKLAIAVTALALGAGGIIGSVAIFGAAHAAVGGPICNVPADYSTIQAAVSDPGCTTVNVAAGVYNENVTINRSLTLNGAQAGIDARTRSASESIINGGLAATLTVTANNVTIDGFTLDGPADSGTATLVMQTGNTGELIQNDIFNNPGRAASFTTSNTTFTQNLVNNVFTTATDGFQANSTPIHDVTISNNTFGGANGSIYNADITIIEGNSNISVTGNTGNGDGTLAAIFKTNGGIVSNNNITGDTHSSAIYIGGANDNISVSGNTVSSAGTAVNIANDFGDGTNSGVNITGNILHNNTTGVKIGAAAVSSSADVTTNKNSLTQNTAFAVNNLSAFTTDATCNWWGAANGPGPVGLGSGDKVSTGVTFSPWLVTSDLNGNCVGGTQVTNKDDCKNGGWQGLTDGTKTFKNQGDCVSFVATGGKNPAAGPKQH